MSDLRSLEEQRAIRMKDKAIERVAKALNIHTYNDISHNGEDQGWTDEECNKIVEHLPLSVLREELSIAEEMCYIDQWINALKHAIFEREVLNKRQKRGLYKEIDEPSPINPLI